MVASFLVKTFEIKAQSEFGAVEEEHSEGHFGSFLHNGLVDHLLDTIIHPFAARPAVLVHKSGDSFGTCNPQCSSNAHFTKWFEER